MNAQAQTTQNTTPTIDMRSPVGRQQFNDALVAAFPIVAKKNVVTLKQLQKVAADHHVAVPPSLLKEPVAGEVDVFKFQLKVKQPWEFPRRARAEIAAAAAIAAAAKGSNVPKTPQPVAPVADHQQSVMNLVTRKDYITPFAVMVPPKDDNYVRWGNHNDLATIIQSGDFHPVFITGETGSGKSIMTEQVCNQLNRPMIRVNVENTSNSDSLIGSKTLIEGNIYAEDGPVVIAMRKGIPILIDEIDAGNSNLLMCLQGVLEGKPLFFAPGNEYITPKHGFNVIVTANTKGRGGDSGRYVGTNVLNEAFLERFACTLEQGYAPRKTELLIANTLMTNLGCPDPKMAESLINWVTTIRETYESGGIDEVISTRRLSHVIHNYKLFGDIVKSVRLATNRFDTSTRDALVSLFEKIYVPAPKVVTPETTKAA